MDKQSFIINALKPYFEDRSKLSFRGSLAEGDLACMYNANGKHCAFGQFINPDRYSPDMEGYSALTLINRYPDILVPEAKEQAIDCWGWNTIQAIHDKLAGIWPESTLNENIKACEDICKVDLTVLRELAIVNYPELMTSIQ